MGFEHSTTTDAVVRDENENIKLQSVPSDVKQASRSNSKLSKIKETADGYLFIANGEFDLVWLNIAAFAAGHVIAAIFVLYLVMYSNLNRVAGAIVFATIYSGLLAGIGVTAGAHRLWSHKSYKAKLPLRILLMVLHTVAGQNCLYIWCRDHRVHHKYSETDGDPHNTGRGFFFAHVGWLLRKKHPKVIIESSKLNFDDLLADPVVKFQMVYYNELYFVFAFLVPLLVPYYFFSLTIFESAALYTLRYLLSLHGTWFVNSSAHMFGGQPYDKRQEGRENSWVSFGALGEGYHNYHHTFPYDYKTAEDGMKLNPTKAFIDFMAAIGQAYDLKVVSQETIERSKLNSAH